MPVVLTIAFGSAGCGSGGGYYPANCPPTATPPGTMSGIPAPASTHLTAKPRSAPHHTTAFLSPEQEKDARRWALRSRVVKRIAGNVPVTAGRVIANFSTCTAQLDAYDVRLHFARPVTLPFGTPVGQSQGELDERSLPPVPLSRPLPPRTTWTAIVNLDGTIRLIN